MNGNLNLINAQLTARELTRQAERWRLARRNGTEADDGWTDAGSFDHRPGTVLIRSTRPEDERALVRLAQLEGRPRLRRFRVLVAEVQGEVLAALPLGGGEPIADPFRPTAPLVEMLKLRAAQLDRSPQPEPRRGLRALLGYPRALGRRSSAAPAGRSC
jgi:hypothetical protein